MHVRELGYASIDADDDGISGWRDRATGAIVTSPPVGQRPADWIDRFGWNIDVSRVKELHHRRSDDPVFLFGAVENEEEVLPLFDVVVCLVADGDTLRDRLTSRQGNDFGKGRGDIDHVLSWLEFYEDRHREIGAVMVDATQPLTAVAQAVVKAAHTAS